MWNLYFHIVLNLLDEEGKSYNTVCSFDFFGAHCQLVEALHIHPGGQSLDSEAMNEQKVKKKKKNLTKTQQPKQVFFSMLEKEWLDTGEVSETSTLLCWSRHTSYRTIF